MAGGTVSSEHADSPSCGTNTKGQAAPAAAEWGGRSEDQSLILAPNIPVQHWSSGPRQGGKKSAVIAAGAGRKNMEIPACLGDTPLL